MRPPEQLPPWEMLETAAQSTVGLAGVSAAFGSRSHTSASSASRVPLLRTSTRMVTVSPAWTTPPVSVLAALPAPGVSLMSRQPSVSASSASAQVKSTASRSGKLWPLVLACANFIRLPLTWFDAPAVGSTTRAASRTSKTWPLAASSAPSPSVQFTTGSPTTPVNGLIVTVLLPVTV